MAKPEWGKKCTCCECGAKFYDMCRTEVSCPKCGAAYVPAAPKPKRAQPAAVPPDAPKKAEPVKAAIDDAEGADDDELDDLDDIDIDVDDDDIDEEDEDIIEDASDLGDDEDDVAEVVAKPEKPEES